MVAFRRYSPYNNIWITYDTSQRKFQQCDKLVAPLPGENYDMQIFKSFYWCSNCPPNNMLGELEILIWVLKNAITRDMHCNWNWFIISQILYEMAPTLKEPLIWDGIGKISWKSQHFSLYERPFNWYHCQPHQSHWTVPLRLDKEMVPSLSAPKFWPF